MEKVLELLFISILLYFWLALAYPEDVPGLMTADRCEDLCMGRASYVSWTSCGCQP